MNIHFTGTIRALVFMSCGLLFGPAFVYADEPQELVFLNWSEYMDPALIEKFEQQYNARVRFVYFESDELRDGLLVDTDAKGFDVICVSSVSIKFYVQRGWLSPISEQDVPNKRHIDARWGEAVPYAKEYAVPLFWGTMGIAYRADLLEQPITSWNQILDPAPALQGRIVLVKDARDLMVMPLKSMGESINSADPAVLERAKALLAAQQPHVMEYSYISLEADSALVKGDALAALVYSGDALMLAEEEENIVYVIPENGSSIWIDYLVVGKASKNKQLAMNFINFLNEPENAAQLAGYVYGASPNRAAVEFLSAEFLSDPVIYPDSETLGKSEFFQELPPRVQKKYNDILPQIVGE